GYEVCAAFWGAIHLGAVPAIFPYLTSDPLPGVYQNPLAALSEFAEAKAVLTLLEFVSTLRQWVTGTGALVITKGPSRTNERNGFIPTSRHSEDLACVQLTTGSTGASKGAMISHRALLNRMASLAATFGIHPDDVLVYWWPLYQTAGLQNVVISPVVLDCLVVSMSPRQWTHHTYLFLQAIHRFRGTCSILPNSGLMHCVRNVRDLDLRDVDLSSWRTLGIGGETIQHESLQAFLGRFTSYHFSATALKPYYVGTECGQISVTRTAKTCQVDWVSRVALDADKEAVPQSSDAERTKPIVSCGVPAPGVEIVIVDEEGRRLPDRRVGEIIVRSPMLFSGYYHRPDLTDRVLREGWVHTGDLGYLAEGQLYLCDRKKDVIIIGGRNVYALDLEATAEKMLGKTCNGVVAFGVPDDALGTERPVLVVEVTKTLKDVDRSDLDAQLRRQIFQEHAVALADVRFVASGWIVRASKISRTTNRRKYAECGFRPPTSQFQPDLRQETATTGTPISSANLEQLVRRLFESALGLHAIGLEESFFELGGDSLVFVNLIVALENHLGRVLPVEELAENPTIAAMTDVLSRETITPRPSVKVLNYGIDPLPVMKQVLVDSTFSWTAKGRRLRELSRIRLTTTGPRLFGYTLPYFIGVKILEIVCRYPEVMRLMFRKRSHVLRRVLAELRNPISEVEALRQHLRTFLWMSWRLVALAQCSPTEFETWVTMTGVEKLQRTREKGQGAVIPLSNIGIRGFSALVLRHLGLTDFMIVGTEDLYAGVLDLLGLSALKERHHFSLTNRDRRRASQLLTAQRLLQQGGIVFIAGDGQLGKLPFLLPLCNRLRHFGFGFAELALRTGVSVFPMFSTVRPGGQVHVEFHGPLEVSGSTHQETVACLVREYVTLLEQYWYKDPGSIRFYSLEKFLELPLATQGGRILDEDSQMPGGVSFLEGKE
ncbi:MAG: AMP-binding protein, partial [Candidatus Binatia bacterium]